MESLLLETGDDRVRIVLAYAKKLIGPRLFPWVDLVCPAADPAAAARS